jgi:hypothetical protein
MRVGWLVGLVLLPATASAHRPTFGEGFDALESAFVVTDNDVSIVLYQELSCDAPEVWMTFDAAAGTDLFVQLGVPQIVRLEDHRPAIAVLAPGLPAAPSLPFAVPDGLGAVVFEASEVAAATTFYEPFTQTYSWVWVEETLALPSDGTGYIVAFDPEGWTGKLWVAVGTVEEFSGIAPEEFASWDQLVNDFHETGAYTPPPDTVEEDCDAGLAGDEPAETPGGCAVGGLPAGSVVALVAAAAVRRRSIRAGERAGSGRHSRR